MEAGCEAGTHGLGLHYWVKTLKCCHIKEKEPPPPLTVSRLDKCLDGPLRRACLLVCFCFIQVLVQVHLTLDGAFVFSCESFVI